MSNPYPERTECEESGETVPNREHTVWEEGARAGREQERQFILQNTDRDERARLEGRREIVEWAHESCPHAPRNFPTDKRMCVQCWGAKLRELGI